MTRMRGMTLIDVIVGIALLLIVFLSLFGILRASLLVSSLARAKAGATTIAQTQMEYLRSLSYDSLGTVGGIPAGIVAAEATTTENGTAYATHTFIQYVDDPADGTGAQDTNGITTDYKRAKVSVTYTIAGIARSVALVSNFAPPGIESSSGGGTLVIDAVDASGAPVGSASVTIVNNSVSPAVDLSTFTDAGGSVELPGAATSTDYQVTVTKSGYSTAQTYARDDTNQNPNPGYLTVTKDQTTTGTFAIDQLANVTLATYSPIATSTFTDTFTDNTLLASMSSTTISGGELVLAAGETSGSALSVQIAPTYLEEWGTLTATSSGSVLLHIYDGNGALVPDTALPGNAAGFSRFPVDLSSLATTTYPSLALGADLESGGAIDGWSLSYTRGPVPLPNVSFTLTGAKTVGSTGSGAPLYKTTVSGSTGAAARETLSLEWDSYALAVSGYALSDACASPPFAIAPAEVVIESLYLSAATANSLRVFVTDSSGVAVPDATVTLTGTGVDTSVESSSCGSAYVGGLPSGTYSITIAKTGYTTTTLSGISISGATTYGASFP